MKRVSLRTACGIFGLLTVSVMTPVLAQDSGIDSSQNALEEVIVTARRVEERLQDVPISMTVLNQDQVADRNIVNSSDLAAYVPSLSMNNTLGTASASFSIRGFVQDIGTDPSVGVYFADVVAPRGGSNNQSAGNGAGPGAFFDLQNLQVLKGPQGTLFGRNTTGGAVLLVPERPTDQQEGYIEFSKGNYNMTRAQAVFNTPLSDSASFRIGLDHQRRNGYVKNTSGIGPEEFNDVDYTAVRASLLVDIDENVENYTILAVTNSDTAGEPMKVIDGDPAHPIGILALAQTDRYANEDFYTVQNDFPNASTEIFQWQLINTTTWQLRGGIEAKNIISYGELTYDLTNPVSGTRFDLSDLNPQFPQGTFVNFTGSNPVSGGHTSHQSTFTEEFRLAGMAFEERLFWQSGIYVEISQPKGESGALANNLLACDGDFNCANPLGQGASTETVSEKDFQNLGVYAQTSFDLTETLTLTSGLRYTSDETEVRGALRRYVYPQGFVPSAPQVMVCTNPDVTSQDCEQTIEQTSDAATWLLGLEYKPSDDMMYYGKYSRGYRTGGVTLQAPPGFRTFEPEEVDAYELGLKGSMMNVVQGTYSISTFYNDFRNQQIQVAFDPRVPGTVAPSSGIVNAGESTIYGAEFEATIVPLQGLTLSISYAYLNTEIDTIDIPEVPVTSTYFIDPEKQPIAGAPLTLTPENKYSISANYTMPLDHDNGEVSVGLIYTHTDEQLSGYAPKNSGTAPRILDDRDLIDLNLTWSEVAGSNYDLAFFANNVTKEEYYTYKLNLSAFQTAHIGTPRMFGLRLRYNFD